MPLYEYECASCAGRFEVLVRSTASDTRPACPDCGSPRVQRALSLVARRGRASDAVLTPLPVRAGGGGGCCGGACGCGH